MNFPHQEQNLAYESGDYKSEPEQIEIIQEPENLHIANLHAADELLPEVTTCAGCNYLCEEQETQCTPKGAGPFCLECWESLIDPGQTLLVEKRLAAAEKNIEQLNIQIAQFQKRSISPGNNDGVERR
jgi:hypothetical protein